MVVKLLVGLLVGLVVATALPRNLAVAEEGSITCAIIVDKGIAQSPLTALLTQKLASPSLLLVEREQIDRVLKEQELSAALGAGAAAERMRLGGLLRAQVLILLKTGPGPKPVLDLVVCESSQGLRLLSTSIASVNPEKAAASMAEVISPALARARRPITGIVAVPPFMSNDLTFRYEALKQAYAQVVQQALMERPGLLVVELEEARAIARETVLAGGIIQRSLPLYFLGEFRHEQGVATPKLSFTLTMKRGEQILGKISRERVERQQAGDAISAATVSLMNGIGAGALAAPDTATEAKALAERARQFRALGNWPEALALIEASLLLQPHQSDLHHNAIIACGEITQSTVRGGGDKLPLQEYQSAIECYLRGLEHLEEFLRTVPSLIRYRVPGQTDFVSGFRNAINGWMVAGRPSSQVLEALSQGRMRAEEILMRIAEMRLRDRRGDETRWVMYAVTNLPEDQKYAKFLEFILRWKDEPGTRDRVRTLATHGYSIEILESPEAKKFLQALNAIDHPEIQAGLVLLQRNVKSAKRPEAPPPVPVAAPSPGGVANLPAPEVAFEPLRLNLNVAGGRIPTSLTINGWIEAGRGIDVLWNYSAVYVMKEKGEIKPLWKPNESNASPAWLVYDGKYVWVPIARGSKPPRLVIIDPAAECSWEVTAADGLPLDALADRQVGRRTESYLRAAAVGPGRACIAGTFGRSWLAMVEFSLDRGIARKSVKLFHEAREQINQEDKSQWERPTVVFAPTYMLTIRSPLRSAESATEARILIGRDSGSIKVGYHPLVVDPNSLLVQVAPDEFLTQQAQAREFERDRVICDGAHAYWLRFTGKRVGDLPLPTLYRAGFPDFRRQQVGTEIVSGETGVFGRMHLFCVNGRGFIAAKQWWTAAALDKPFLLLKGDVPERGTIEGFAAANARGSNGADQETVRNVFTSNHYGVVCATDRGGNQSRLYRVEFKNLPPASDAP